MDYYPFRVETSGAPYIQRRDGGYIKYYSAAIGGGNPQIEVTTDTGDKFLLLPGESARVGGEAKEWRIANVDRIAPIVGIVVIGEASEAVESARVSGEVSVYDGSAARTVGGLAFIQGFYCGAVVGEYPHAAIENPAGSGKRISIKSIRLKSASAITAFWTFEAGQLSSVNGGAVSKWSDGSVGVGVSRRQNSAALLLVGGTVDDSPIAANVAREILYQEPLVLEPGKSIAFASVTATNTDLGGSAETVEIAI